MDSFSLPPNGGSCQIKDLLRKHGVSQAGWRRLKRQADFYIDGQKSFFYANVLPGQTLVVDSPPVTSVLPRKGFVSIKYEDDFFLVIDKDPGVLVHPTVAQESDTLANYVAYYMLNRKDFDGVHLVSRLDRDTSGLVLFAKKSRMQHILSKTAMCKKYLALTEKPPPAALGVIDLPVSRMVDSIIERTVSVTGKPARTHYKIMTNYGKLWLLEFEPVTGRTHQIRVHAAALGCPLYGDSLYGAKTSKTRHALHASELSFLHPATGKMLFLNSELPTDFNKIIYAHSKSPSIFL